MALRSWATAKPAHRAATSVKVYIVYVCWKEVRVECEGCVMQQMKAATKMNSEVKGCLRKFVKCEYCERVGGKRRFEGTAQTMFWKSC